MKTTSPRFTFLVLSLLCLFSVANATETTAPVISARSPQVLASYEQTENFIEGLAVLKPKLQSVCKNLLDSQLRLQATTDSWKMYSLYEMLDNQHLMTAELVRVGTVTELAGSIPQYTAYRQVALGQTPLDQLKSGSIVIADKGTTCGPDPLSLIKGAYFMKCGDFLIGSGLIAVSELNKASCLNLRLLVNPAL